MSQFASIDAVALLQDLRRGLVNFADDAKVAVAEADADVARTLRWLEMEQQPLWEQQYKKREEKVKEAQEAFRKKTLYKAVDGTAQSVVDERKALQRARASLEEADAKRKMVKAWRIKLEQEALVYRGLMQPVMRAADSDIPTALARLDRMHDALDRYLSLSAPVGGQRTVTGGEDATVARPSAAPSMARPAEESPHETSHDTDAADPAAGPDAEESNAPKEPTA